MKKIQLLALLILASLSCFPTILYAKETSHTPIYAITTQGENLVPEDFIPAIEEENQMKVTDISFADNNRANTITTGTFKTTLAFTDSSKNKHKEKLSYIIYSKEPTLSFNDLSYDTKSKDLTISLDHSQATIYMTANQQNYRINLDSNGNFHGKYNPGELPKEMTFIALDDNGNWSDTQTLNLSTHKIKAEKNILTATDYNQLKNNSKPLAETGSHRSKRTFITLAFILILSILLIIIYRYFSVKKQN